MPKIWIDICTSDKNGGLYKKLLDQYFEREDRGEYYGRCYQSYDEITRAYLKERPQILILAMDDDIDNQEIAIWVRERSKKVCQIWIGQDTRFAVAAFRTRVKDFLLMPITQAAFFNALDTCFEEIRI